MVIAIILFIGGIALAKTFFIDSRPVTSAQITQRVQIQPPKTTMTINKEFQFPLKDEKGQEIAKIKYLLDKAEKRDEILIKGQKATVISGRTFLIINLKITNGTKQKIQMNTRDYIRLTIKDDPELLAPDIHNDPVEIQAISTKYTRVGFPISDNDKNLKLQVGEINGDKETINLNLP